MTGADVALVVSVFVAAIVEFVEAFTIVLAIGLTRGWRSAFAGIAAAVVALTILTSILGVLIVSALSESLLQLVIGTFLLIFGLQWLRKAVLRSAGFKAMHDESEAFEEARRASAAAGSRSRAGIDAYGFVVSFKGVFLEGVEIVFIVVTFGSSAGHVGLAAAAAAAAGIVVVIAGFALRRPMSAVPENLLKYFVAILLTSFGTFWSVEGSGYFTASSESAHWPGGDAALVALVACWFVVSQGLIAYLRRLRGLPQTTSLTGSVAP